MRILSVFWSDEVVTGAHKRLIHLLRGLADCDHEIHLITKKNFAFDLGSVRAIELEEAGLPSNKLDALWRLTTHSLSPRLVQETDVIVCFGLGSVVPGVYLKKKTGARLLYALRAHPIRNVLEDSFARQKFFEATNSAYLSLGVWGADRFAVQVRRHKNELVRKYGLKENEIEVIPNNIIEGIKNCQNSERVKDILFAGTICKRKGVDTLLKAFGEVLVQGKDLTLHIAGKGPMESWVQSYISQNDLERQVVVHGFVDEVMRLMARCELVVIPSRVETFPNVALEAMSVGVPFITSDLEELQAAFGQAAEYFPTDDPKALANKIESLCDPDSYVRLKQKVERQRDKFVFDWVGEFEALMEDMLEE